MLARILAPLALLMAGAPLSAAAPVAGRWTTPDRDSVIEIASCGAKQCGRIVRLLKPVRGSATDRNNPDAGLRSRTILGLPVLTDFIDGGSEWRGRIYDPRTGKTYRSTLAIGAGGVLRVKGCVAFFCQTQEWRRAQ